MNIEHKVHLKIITWRVKILDDVNEPRSEV